MHASVVKSSEHARSPIEQHNLQIKGTESQEKKLLKVTKAGCVPLKRKRGQKQEGAEKEGKHVSRGSSAGMGETDGRKQNGGSRMSEAEGRKQKG